MRQIFLFLTVILMSSCTYRGVYEGLQTSARNECVKLRSPQYEECVEGLGTTYDDYEKTRDAVISKQ